jgi:hypothetical protein
MVIKKTGEMSGRQNPAPNPLSAIPPENFPIRFANLLILEKIFEYRLAYEKAFIDVAYGP